MHRCSFVSVIILLAIATSSQAAIFLQSSAGTDIGSGLTAYTLIATSDAGEIINGVGAVSITPNLDDAGLHQVWTPIVNGATPTRQEQLGWGPLWSDTWLPFDSYFFFSSANSLSIGDAFTETNSGANGIVLPSAGFGAPITGFGTYSGPGAKAFTIASGLQGNNVSFAQLVMKASEAVLVDIEVFTSGGITATFQDFFVGCMHCGPSIFDLDLGDVIRGEAVTATLQVHPLDFLEPGTWALDSFIGPGGGAVAGASVDPNTGEFSWNSDLQPLGDYSAIIGATVNGSPASGTLSFNLVVPEPATLSLLSIAMVVAAGFMRRR